MVHAGSCFIFKDNAYDVKYILPVVNVYDLLPRYLIPEVRMYSGFRHGALTTAALTQEIKACLSDERGSTCW
jgi:hypothetical protein